MAWYDSLGHFAATSPLVNPYAQGQLAYQTVRGGGTGKGPASTVPGGGGRGGMAPPVTGAAGGSNGTGPPAANPMLGSTARGGPGHFLPPPGSTGPQSEARSGSGHFGVAPPAPTPPAGGSQSGPGILEQWFNQRANGTDPAFEYASKRGMEALGNQSSAAGNFNSGAARQGEGDFMSNLISQREGQLDALAGGASGEHQGRVNSMFSQGMGLASGQAGTMGSYDLASAHSNDALMEAIVQMLGGKAGVDDKSRQQGVNNALGIAALA